MPTVSQIPDSRIDRLIELSIERCTAQRAPFLSLNDMKRLAQLVEEQANAIGLPIVFSLVDPNGVQKYFFSQPDALLISHELAFKKAYSAVALRIPTHLLAEQMAPGADLYGLQQLNNISGVGGGFPCWHRGKIVAGIGVSGGTVAQDMMIVINALAQFSRSDFELTPQRT
ncbi:GlcG/HbpS family heme-binding protein [Budvicia diplopodorum]|uniref:GlcG/HbpS family heme-binding protein n=1 Tax=Budvicia diplopodorum TaxID=1119056 RepID=UPI00135C6FD6|nr:heme-binding protein [Budvicia diplopodorum]